MSPFATCTEDRIDRLSETGLLRSIREWLGPAAPESPFGMGDDSAIIRPAADIATTDSLIWMRHFDEKVSPENAGAKLIKRGVSDIAAMGGHPDAALVNALLPRNVSYSWLEKFTRSMGTVAQRYGFYIVGGDLAELTETPAFTVTVLGHSEGRILQRVGGRAGDLIAVSGTIGGSILHKHYSFEPRIELGKILASHSQVHAAIDLTDGMAKDLPALLPPGTAAELVAADMPLSKDASTLARSTGLTPLHHALHDGEDYELLFLIAREARPWLRQLSIQLNLPLTIIGQVVASALSDRIFFADIPDPEISSGYEHFGPAS